MTRKNAFQQYVDNELWYDFLKMPLSDIVEFESFGSSATLKVIGREFDLIVVDAGSIDGVTYRLSTFDPAFKTNKVMTKEQVVNYVMKVLLAQFFEMLNIFDINTAVKRLIATGSYDAMQQFELRQALSSSVKPVNFVSTTVDNTANDAATTLKALQQQAEEKRKQLREYQKKRYAARKNAKGQLTREQKVAIKQGKDAKDVIVEHTPGEYDLTDTYVNQMPQQNNCHSKVMQIVDESAKHYKYVINRASQLTKRNHFVAVVLKCILIEHYSQTSVAKCLCVSQATINAKLDYICKLYKESYSQFVDMIESLPQSWHIDIANATEAVKYRIYKRKR